MQDSKENYLKIKEGLRWAITRSFMGLLKRSSNSDWLHTLQGSFQFKSHAMHWGVIASLRVAMQFSDPDDNIQISLAELEALDERG